MNQPLHSQPCKEDMPPPQQNMLKFKPFFFFKAGNHYRLFESILKLGDMDEGILVSRIGRAECKPSN